MLDEFRISQTGTEPPSAARVALNAAPTALAVVASLRPIGVPSGRMGRSLSAANNWSTNN